MGGFHKESTAHCHHQSAYWVLCRVLELNKNAISSLCVSTSRRSNVQKTCMRWMWAAFVWCLHKAQNWVRCSMNRKAESTTLFHWIFRSRSLQSVSLRLSGSELNAPCCSCMSRGADRCSLFRWVIQKLNIASILWYHYNHVMQRPNFVCTHSGQGLLSQKRTCCSTCDRSQTFWQLTPL